MRRASLLIKLPILVMGREWRRAPQRVATAACFSCIYYGGWWLSLIASPLAVVGRRTGGVGGTITRSVLFVGFVAGVQLAVCVGQARGGQAALAGWGV